MNRVKVEVEVLKDTFIERVRGRDAGMNRRGGEEEAEETEEGVGVAVRGEPTGGTISSWQIKWYGFGAPPRCVSASDACISSEHHLASNFAHPTILALQLLTQILFTG